MSNILSATQKVDSIYFLKDTKKSILKLLLVSRVKDSVFVCIFPYNSFQVCVCVFISFKCLIILHNVNIKIKISKIT